MLTQPLAKKAKDDGTRAGHVSRLGGMKSWWWEWGVENAVEDAPY